MDVSTAVADVLLYDLINTVLKAAAAVWQAVYKLPNSPIVGGGKHAQDTLGGCTAPATAVSNPHPVDTVSQNTPTTDSAVARPNGRVQSADGLRHSLLQMGTTSEHWVALLGVASCANFDIAVRSLLIAAWGLTTHKRRLSRRFDRMAQHVNQRMVQLATLQDELQQMRHEIATGGNVDVEAFSQMLRVMRILVDDAQDSLAYFARDWVFCLTFSLSGFAIGGLTAGVGLGIGFVGLATLPPAEVAAPVVWLADLAWRTGFSGALLGGIGLVANAGASLSLQDFSIQFEEMKDELLEHKGDVDQGLSFIAQLESP